MQSDSKRTTPKGVQMNTIVANSFIDVALGVITREYAPLRHAAKRLAKDARVSHRTAEAWLSGRKQISGEAAWSLLSESETFADEVIMRLIEIRRERERKVK